MREWTRSGRRSPRPWTTTPSEGRASPSENGTRRNKSASKRRTSPRHSRDFFRANPRSSRETMPEATRVDAFVGRLEDRIAREVDGQDRVALAYSGGLSSMTIAMIARKRCNLECFVAGREGEPGG